MFDQLLPPLYLQLRIKSGLSKTKLAPRLGVSRHSVANYESGHTRPDADYERRLIEIAECSPVEVAQMLCELLAAHIERPVAVLEPLAPEPEEPRSVLDRAESTARELKRFIPASMYRALANKIHITHMMKVTLDRQTADLEELASDCRTTAGPHARGPGNTPMGATGPTGPVCNNRTVGTPSARSQSRTEPKPEKGTNA